MSDKYILDDSGEPVPTDDLAAWGNSFRSLNRQLASDEIDDVRISTVFLGLDHSFGFGPPVLWETMVFGGTLDQEQDRYTSKAEALAGHAAMVARVKAAIA